MLIKYFKYLIILILLSQTSLYAKNKENNDFNSKNLSKYFSAILSYNNNQHENALKFFKSSKSLTNKHTPYLKQYVYSLIMEGKVERAIQEIKYNINKKNSDFFEAYLLLILDSIRNKDLNKSVVYLEKLNRFKNNGNLELVVYQSLKEYIYIFKERK